jgi:DNA-nicking Smr family endonuclease
MDLHGLTVQDAYNEFQYAVNECRSKGIKKLKVITGKGQISSEFPHWCDTNPKIKSWTINHDKGSYLVRIAYN